MMKNANAGRGLTWPLVAAAGRLLNCRASQLVAILAIAAGSLAGVVGAEPFRFTMLAYPGASGTSVSAIDGNLIVGSYTSDGRHGFLYGAAFTTIDFPVARTTVLTEVSGDRLGGYYDTDRRRGFVYQNGVFTTIDPPQTSDNFFNGSEVHGLSGDTVVGGYMDSGQITHGFVYNGASYASFDVPGGPTTTITGRDGARLVGSVGGGMFGYLFDGTTFKELRVSGAQLTVPLGIHGDVIVGYTLSGSAGVQGFLYRNNQYQLVGLPREFASQTSISDVWGNTAIGNYIDRNRQSVAFMFKIPEPGTSLLLTAAASLVWVRRRRL